MSVSIKNKGGREFGQPVEGDLAQQPKPEGLPRAARAKTCSPGQACRGRRTRCCPRPPRSPRALAHGRAAAALRGEPQAPVSSHLGPHRPPCGPSAPGQRRLTLRESARPACGEHAEFGPRMGALRPRHRKAGWCFSQPRPSLPRASRGALASPSTEGPPQSRTPALAPAIRRRPASRAPAPRPSLAGVTGRSPPSSRSLPHGSPRQDSGAFLGPLASRRWSLAGAGRAGARQHETQEAEGPPGAAHLPEASASPGTGTYSTSCSSLLRRTRKGASNPRAVR